MYSFTKAAAERPIRKILFGRWVAIGAEVVINRPAPQLNEVVKIPTQKELEELSKLPKYKDLIKYEQPSQPKKSDKIEDK